MYMTSSKIRLICVLCVFYTAIPVLAVLPEKSAESYKSFGKEEIITLPKPTAAIPSAAQAAQENKAQIIKTLQNSMPWQNFTQKAGRGWSVRWNAKTKTPHAAVGRPIALSAAPLTEDNIDTVCEDFISEHSDLMGVRPGQLRRLKAVKAEGRWHSDFEQVHNGVPVFGSRVKLSFAANDGLVAFGSDVYSDVNVDTVPLIERKDAERIAVDDCNKTAGGDDRISDVNLCILPVRRGMAVDYALCWRLDILQPKVQKKWQYFIDAKTGKIAGRQNILWYANISGDVMGEVKPEFASDPTAVRPFAYEEIIAEGAEKLIQSWDFNSDPGWMTEGAWAFGVPSGEGTACGDPCSGYTGANVYCYELNGDYLNNMPAYHLTTTPIGSSGYETLRLKFMRWLGVESSYYDKAGIEVSNNGADWVSLWNNPTKSMCDGQWVGVSYDLPPLADNQPNLYLRWSMGPTDFSVTFPGWNIDDVQLFSVLGGINTEQTNSRGSYRMKAPWKPSKIISQLRGLYCDINNAYKPDAQFVRTDVYPHDVINWVWDSNLYNTISESSVYWHINHIHDYYKSIDKDFNGLDFLVSVFVDVNFSNAYWDGINLAFGRGDGVEYGDFALYSEVVYHEYTHGVTDKIYDGVFFPYRGEQGAMNEAWSDYFGCVLSDSQSPEVGDGGLVINEPNGFRSLNNTYRRETDWSNEVHADSEMFSGSLWEIGQSLGDKIADKLVHFARYEHPMSFEDCLAAILLEDDNRYGDGDITNGTLHGRAIYTAFGNHGIGGLEYLGPSMVITDDSVNRNGRLEPGETGKLSLTLINRWADALKIRATLSSTDAFVRIVKPTTLFTNAEYGGTTDNSADPFIISVEPNCPETHTIYFMLSITARGQYSYSRNCLIYYNVAVQQYAYDDGGIDDYVNHGEPNGAWRYV